MVNGWTFVFLCREDELAHGGQVSAVACGDLLLKELMSHFGVFDVEHVVHNDELFVHLSCHVLPA